ncbi:porin [Limibacterium fermenti]|uniref:porin n=1 Tax=Limibacterium fermenti TaxID=3229863 RepID=UPI000E8A6F75|nr:hypothetical protein [Porphyromonadaceae bacterium]
MKRGIILVIYICCIGSIIFAQQNASYPDESTLLERVAKVEKKADKFNFFLNMHSSFDSYIDNDGFQGSGFNMRQFRIEAKGNINDWLSYRWRQRLNRPNDAGNAFDNMPTSIDVAGIGVKLSDKLSLFAGKQCAAYGGIEFDLNPIEIYEYSDMIEYMSNFLTGINIAYDITPAHQLQFQVLNGLNNTFEKTYIAPGIEKSKLPFVYTLNWNGNMFGGAYKTRWSASIMSEAKSRNQLYLAFGNDIIFSPKANMFFDIMYSREGLDREGIMSTILHDGTRNAFDAGYLSFVSKFNFRVHPLWNVFLQGIYETASLTKTYDEFEKGKYRTSLGYFTGIEYYPMESNLHFFLTYVGRAFQYEKRAALTDYHTNRISVGFIYQLPMF